MPVKLRPANLAKDDKDPIVRHAPTRKKVGIIGAVRANDGTLVAREEEKFNAQLTEAFFNELIRYRSGEKTMVVILDNARYHHAKALSPWKEQHYENFKLEFLPAYSPELCVSGSDQTMPLKCLNKFPRNSRRRRE